MEPGDDRRGWMKAFAEITTLGLTFPLAIAAGYGIGWWLDGKFGTGPWLTIAGTALGVVSAFVQLFRLAAKDDAKTGDRGDPDAR